MESAYLAAKRPLQPAFQEQPNTPEATISQPIEQLVCYAGSVVLVLSYLLY